MLLKILVNTRVRKQNRNKSDRKLYVRLFTISYANRCHFRITYKRETQTIASLGLKTVYFIRSSNILLKTYIIYIQQINVQKIYLIIYVYKLAIINI